MTVSQLAYVGIGVSQMARWQTFATEVLGLQVVTTSTTWAAASTRR